LPQELDEKMCQYIYNVLRSISNDDFSKVMTVVASLGSRPERVLDSANCSPGEWRKLFFGLGVLREINLIIMDEPTNHLDLPSIECLGSALGACDSALLLVSHDQVFLGNLCGIDWNIEAIGENRNILKKHFFHK
jgi:ATPase subunit of ABC transporter with duplicated ATPase domains